MKISKLILVLWLLFTLIGFTFPAYAKIHMVILDVCTNGENQSIVFWVTVDDLTTDPPSVVTSIIVTAPDGTQFDMTKNTWYEAGKSFNSDNIFASNFLSGAIPSGLYKVAVMDNTGTIINATDRVTVDFLTPPEVTDPVEGSTVLSLTPKIIWTPVPGAEAYRIHLWNDTWNHPIWWWISPNIKYSNKHSFMIPPGVLREGFHYRIQIQARDALKDVDNRASGTWRHFSTP
jgi:hypothetical protein